MKSIKEKVQALRDLMKKEKLDAYIIPTNGPHNSEYPALHWSHREWISGFTGSAGTVAITQTGAGLWTDARYFEQAEAQLAGSGITLYRMGVSGEPDLLPWIMNQIKKGGHVAAAAAQVMRSDYSAYRKRLKADGFTFSVVDDLIGRIWLDRPPLKKDLIFEHDAVYAGKTRKQKLTQLCKRIKKAGAQATIVTALDDIGWLLNLRGHDVDFNPVFYAYLWVEKKNHFLFIDTDKVDPGLQIILAKENIDLVPYEKIRKKLKQLSRGKVVAIDRTLVNMEIYDRLRAKTLIDLTSPVMQMKAIKNRIEIEHLRKVMVKDGVALAKAFYWLDKELDQRTVSEFEFGEQLAICRGQLPLYYGESFSPIVGYQSNGAVIHYRAEEATCKAIRKEGVLLVDSGGQYLDGTTDITRTFAMGEVTPEQKKQYTLVLKGHIALAAIHFPQGTTGIQLDAITRQFLWSNNLDYGHGTGHGVGFFMNVHEPPQGFAPKLTARGTTPHQPGMYTSNEPGYYETGSHGIRLENLVICREVTDQSNFLCHETITLYPFDLKFIDQSLLTGEEVTWLNDYHKRVEEALIPHLSEDEAAWLSTQCQPLD